MKALKTLREFLAYSLSLLPTDLCTLQQEFCVNIVGWDIQELILGFGNALFEMALLCWTIFAIDVFIANSASIGDEIDFGSKALSVFFVRKSATVFPKILISRANLRNLGIGCCFRLCYYFAIDGLKYLYFQLLTVLPFHTFFPSSFFFNFLYFQFFPFKTKRLCFFLK